MKKLMMAVAALVLIAGFASAQTKPAPSTKKSAKKETTAPAPAKDSSAPSGKKNHAKKH